MKRLLRYILVGVLTTATAGAEKIQVYFGSGTTGIFRSILDLNSGQLTEAKQAAEATRSGFIALHPDGTHLYSIGKPAGYSGSRSGSVCAYKIDPATGNLEFLNTQPTKSIGPCYLTVDPAGRNVLVAHYRGGSCATLPLAKDGSLKPVSSFHQHTGSSVDPKRQTTPHPHCIVLDPPGHYAFRYDAGHGTLKEFQTLSTLPNDFTGRNANAGICGTPDGRFLYVSNRGHNSIAQFAIDPNSGTLSPLGNESTLNVVPQAINIDPFGSCLIATDKNSGDVSVFKIDKKTGKLAHTGCTINVPKAGSIDFLPLD